MSEPRPPLPRRTPGDSLGDYTHPTRYPDRSGYPAAPDPDRLNRAGQQDEPAGRLRAFANTVLGLHQVTPGASGFIPMCSCGLPARHCAIVRAAHDVLGIAVPFSYDPPSPPYYEV